MVYKFDTEEEAKNAVLACNIYYGIPKENDSVTTNWCEYLPFIIDEEIQFYYINFDETLKPILGHPNYELPYIEALPQFE